VKKTLTRKFIYVLAALSILAMLIPAMAVPASAAGTPSLTIMIQDPTTGLYTIPDGVPAYNVAGSKIMVTASNVTPTGWALVDVPTPVSTSGSTFITPTATPNTAPIPTSVYVQGVQTDTLIECFYLDANSNTQNITIEKKWGTISGTTITPPQTVPVTWNEAAKMFSANATITDTVTGSFVESGNVTTNKAVQGVVFNWYLIAGNVAVDLTPGMANALNTRMAGYATPTHTIFSTGGTNTITSSNSTGSNTVTLNATGEEGVQVVVVPAYPFPVVNINVVPEITTVDFYTTEMEVVPQVRWAGEKIVLEKYWGPDPVTANASFNGYPVQFSLQQGSVGALEPINGGTTSGPNVQTNVDTNGGSSCILTSSDTGVSNVVAGLYNKSNVLINQHYFTVYWLKFESLTLGDVQGKRLGHFAGLWDPPNPWSTSTDNITQTLNVSQDALLRARVRGWFVSSDPSSRPERFMDYTNSSGIPNGDPAVGTYGPTILDLPKGRWILPDDWPSLGGGPGNWQQSRMHWDLMDTPNGNVGSYSGLNNVTTAANGYEGNNGGTYAYNANSTGTPPPTNALTALSDAGNAAGLGNYYKIKTNNQTLPPTGTYVQPPLAGIKLLVNPVLAGPTPGAPSNNGVIGPFSPGLELMTPTGWKIAGNPNYDPARGMMDQTVVPDGNLDWWDAPMPPAKIIFQIQKSTATPPDTTATAGFFKSALKTDIYYIWLPDPNNNTYPMLKVYTNPFYQEMIPAHEAIPAFINNGGYDWNSFDKSYGPYVFWQFINQNRYQPLVTSSDPSGHPTAVEVYSDNHGEAMVWLNGNWNLDLSHYNNSGSADVPYQNTVGSSTIQATADYPYTRVHEPIQSNLDVKTFQWGGLILGTDQHQYGDLSLSNGPGTRLVLASETWLPSTVTGTYPFQSAQSLSKVVWLFVSDRDGKQAGVNGAEVDWNVANFTGAQTRIDTRTGWLSGYNPITQAINLSQGFLNGTITTGGGVTDGVVRQHGTSYLKPILPNSPEAALFNKFFGSGYSENSTSYQPPSSSAYTGLNPLNFCVAALEVTDQGAYTSIAYVNATVISHDFDLLNQPNTSVSQVVYQTKVDFTKQDNLDDGIIPGDANCDGVINMADVVATERMILGLNRVTSNAVLNTDGTVDMGTVVKIERTILGLPNN